MNHIYFFRASGSSEVHAVQAGKISDADELKLAHLFGGAEKLSVEYLSGKYLGPRREMISPWSTNAVEITANMGIRDIKRIEKFIPFKDGDYSDPMLQEIYEGLDQELFRISRRPEPIIEVTDIAACNRQEGLALSDEEVEYLEKVSLMLGRPLTDSEVFGFSQVNSEHCRHKIFNGTFIINGNRKDKSLFQLIRDTSRINPNRIVSAYSDNVAFIRGPVILQFAPESAGRAAFFENRKIETVLSLKAETHNFPTTVEPFNGAATGSGGEIRDRMAGGTASIPLAGSAVYMTSFPRSGEGRSWEKNPERKWLYRSPSDILVSASDGASDFGNKFGQPLICGSVLTFEHEEGGRSFGYDKVIMLAGGVGYTRKEYASKRMPEPGDRIIVMGGDNYRIGMGGSSVSSLATGELSNTIELNAVQRSNPEMQKRVSNVIRAMAESSDNPIISIHDHGAGGHLNCLSELVENTGGVIYLDRLPVGDQSLSAREIICNESQERMGLVVSGKDSGRLQALSERERAPFFDVGEITKDMNFCIENSRTGEKPVDWALNCMFGSSPETIIEGVSDDSVFSEAEYHPDELESCIKNVLQLEDAACKDWLTGKVDRSVTGKVVMQQTTGAIQLPINDAAIVALDFRAEKGIVFSIGHAPVIAMTNPEAASRIAIAESLTNLVWAPVEDGISGVSLSANWMWPAGLKHENERLYRAVSAASEFAVQLGINIPTGKDSLSMTQKYPDGKTVSAPGTVIISAMAECPAPRLAVSTELKAEAGEKIYYIDFSGCPPELGGSCLSRIKNSVGGNTPDVKDAKYFRSAFAAVQKLVREGLISAGHDISAGGMITALLEMCFPTPGAGLKVRLSSLKEKNVFRALFAENPGVLIQAAYKDCSLIANILKEHGLKYAHVADISFDGRMEIEEIGLMLDISEMRDIWFRSSYLLDRKQSSGDRAERRYENYGRQPLHYSFADNWKGYNSGYNINPCRKDKSGINAAIVREKGVNGDREMAYALWLAGFDVKDIHMTDLISGRETLEDIRMLAFPGGFSNSDVPASARGWAGSFLYNEKAREALKNFYERKDTLSIGVCNGCQLMVHPGITPYFDGMELIHNESGRFESAFVNVDIPENNSVMLKSLSGQRLGVWVAHGEGRFRLKKTSDSYIVGMRYSYSEYPGNPNGSDDSIAGIVSSDGRHLAIMPHIERSLMPWNWPYYPPEKKHEDISPWVEAFCNAFKWFHFL